MLLAAPQILSTSDASGKSEVGQSFDDIMIFGDINVRSAQNGNIVLIIDSRVAGSSDGTPDMVVRFAPLKKKAKYQNLSFDLSGARLFMEARRMAVIGNDGHTWISLSLEPIKKDDPSFGLYGDSSTDLAQTVRISKGIVLLRETIRPLDDGSLPIVDIERNIFIEKSKMRTQDGEFELEGECQAGGPGSTQCSTGCTLGSCSASCTNGFYACCKCGLVVLSCSCIRNP
jgi:hypothetical protein